MSLHRAQFAKLLEPGLNALFGLEYAQYPEEWKEYDQELQEIQNRQSYQENVGQRMAPPLSATKQIIDAAKDGGKMLIDKAKTGTLADPNVQQRFSNFL